VVRITHPTAVWWEIGTKSVSASRVTCSSLLTDLNLSCTVRNTRAVVKGMSAGFGPRLGHCREEMAPACVGPGIGQPMGFTFEWCWQPSDKTAATFRRGYICVIRSLFSPKTRCAR
jgi:hypothetical protein